MRVVLQRVSRATVRVDGETVGAIERGLLALIGVETGDRAEQARAAVDKIASLRIFEDDQGKMNLDVATVGGGVLVVSQFTLAANLRRGRRPSFEPAAPPAEAEPLVETVVAGLRERGLPVATGSFGASMEVELINQGPVTFVLEFPPSPASG